MENETVGAVRGQRALALIIQVLSLGRYLLITAGGAFLLWKAASVLLQNQSWSFDMVAQVALASALGSGLLWLSGKWVEMMLRAT